MRGRARPAGRLGRRAAAVALLGALLAGCATFPDDGHRDWREKSENSGELGGPPSVPDPGQTPQPGPQGGAPGGGGGEAVPSGCVDPDPQVVATCLAPVGAIAVLPDRLALVVRGYFLEQRPMAELA